MPFWVLIPVTLNVGLMKPRKGLPGSRARKNWGVGKATSSLDKYPAFLRY